ncbi:T9SS type A sorting domain-containing protein [Epilithonimonas sp.]|uniref:T9SS type A sorting domain-containing protein n=1 Tax=Epilithonimonas sp. TaxID=2894511 RepID=UPI0035B1B575
MKKLYILIFAANLFSAQNPELLNNKWQITKVVGELLPTDQIPPAMPYQQITEFSANPSKLNLSFFNTVGAEITYTGDNMFIVNSKACTLADYWGDNGQVNSFFGLLCDFFKKDANYFYNISNNGNEKILTVSNATFQEIHFKSAILATKENDINKISVYPNPSSDIIKIEKLKPNSSLELTDVSGKAVKTMANIKSDKTEINIKNLPLGIYYLNVNGQPVQKIIKK